MPVPNHAGFSDKEAAYLKTLNPMLAPGQTIVESDTQRSKTNKDEVEYSFYNDIPYNDAVLVFSTTAEVKNEIVSYREDQILFIKDLNGLYSFDSLDSTTADDNLTVLVDSSNRRLKKLGKMAPAQADSVATDVAGLKADFNTLLANLRTAGILTA